jgi:hypothetical protein
VGGKKACPICGPDELEVRWSDKLNKVVYEGYRKYLPRGHRLLRAEYKDKFNGKMEHRDKPIVHNQEYWETQWNRVKDGNSPDKTGIHKLSSFYRLPYFKVCTSPFFPTVNMTFFNIVLISINYGGVLMQKLLLPHLLDPMHIEKNIVVSLMKTLSSAKGTKADGRAVREDLKAAGKMSALHEPDETSIHPTSGDLVYKYKRAPWVWSKAEFNTVMKLITEIKTPSNYGSSMALKFTKDKIVGMKTHDWHNVLHDFLPIAIRGTLTPDVRKAVYMLSHFFKNLCAKEFNMVDLPRLELDGYEAMCHLEMTLPPSFFDIQPHLLIHLVREVQLAGPVHYRWMYFVERYMKCLKDWVRQQALPESSMAEGYISQETMVLASEYAMLLDLKAPRLWKIAEDPEMKDELLPSAATKKKLRGVIYEQAHSFVLNNHPALSSWRNQYDELLAGGAQLKPYRDWLQGAVELASKNNPISDDVWDLSRGPHERARFFSSMWSRGRHFRVASRDSMVRRTQDSYISSFFDMGQIHKVEFIGQVESIIQLDYRSLKQTLIRGQWYYNNKTLTSESSTLIVDECGFNKVKSRNFMRSNLLKDEPFVYPWDCNQVFVVSDRLKAHWKIVVDAEVRRTRVYETNSTETSTTEFGESSSFVEFPENDIDEGLEVEEYVSDVEAERAKEAAIEADLEEEEIPKYYTRRKRVVNDVELDQNLDEEVVADEETPLTLSDGEEELPMEREVDVHTRDEDHEELVV